MSARDVWLWYVMEIRSALRERNIVVNSLLLPLLLYPAMLWLMLSGFSFVQGQTEGLTSRVLVAGEPTVRDAFAERLRTVGGGGVGAGGAGGGDHGAEDGRGHAGGVAGQGDQMGRAAGAGPGQARGDPGKRAASVGRIVRYDGAAERSG